MPKEDNHDEYLKTILALFSEEPRGLSISDISREIGLNRNSVSKYVNMLSISGRVEMKMVGPSKVYFLSERVPVSALIDFSTDAIVLLDEKLKVVTANDHYLLLAGVAKEDLTGTRIQDFDYPILSTDAFLSRIPRYGEGEQVLEAVVPDTGAGERHFRVKILPAAFEGGDAGYAVIIEETTERRQSEERIASALREKEALLRELHLRVKNNLQMIASLINLQKMESGSDEVAAALRETENRVLSLSLAHELLYAEAMIAEVDMKAYLELLIGELRRSYDLMDSGIACELPAHECLLDADSAIAVGLIVNELVALAAGTDGTCNLHVSGSISPDDGTCCLKVIADEAVERTDGLGMALVRTLVNRELNGTLSILPDGWEVRF
ncbi:MULTISPECIES: sensor histidine kinase [Methanocalculus]|uniref:sensor histidine kinase n=1 Tax=Methanocalculus TaxID=71151 RepID=UPI0020A16C37|nr:MULTISPECIES: histidine kinase dimerization/phosphoacceptor domain -containing protein [unclassified Methanocalculus]MCP1661435.1 PAS domain S-box-containing protein [Methanocalculus sp. AMF5]